MRKLLMRKWAGWKARKQAKKHKPVVVSALDYHRGKTRRPRKVIAGRVVTPELRARLQKTEYGKLRLEELDKYERELNAKRQSPYVTGRRSKPPNIQNLPASAGVRRTRAGLVAAAAAAIGLGHLR